MTIQDYGSIGEIVGAIATVATLLYLAVQIRQNGKLVAASVADASRDAQNEAPRVIAASDDAARIWAIGLEARSELTPEESHRFSSLLYLAFSSFHQQFRHGLKLEDETSYLLVRPGVKEWWRAEGSPTFTDDFRAHITHLMRQQSTAAQHSAAADSARDE